jgi:hypothetical protein
VCGRRRRQPPGPAGRAAAALADQRQLIGTLRYAATGAPRSTPTPRSQAVALVARLAADGAVAPEQLVNAGVEPPRRGPQESIASAAQAPAARRLPSMVDRLPAATPSFGLRPYRRPWMRA